MTVRQPAPFLHPVIARLARESLERQTIRRPMAPEILKGYEEPRPVTLIGPMVQPVSTCGLERVFTSDSDLVARFFHRVTHPWEFPDRNPMPTFDLFPRLTRVGARVAQGRRRARATWLTLRHGPCTCDDGDD